MPLIMCPGKECQTNKYETFCFNNLCNGEMEVCVTGSFPKENLNEATF
jgi:hypothetical protein